VNNRAPTAWILACLLLAAALWLGYAGAGSHRLFLLAAVAVVVFALGAFAYARPDEAVVLAVALVLLGGTKFRERDVLTSSDVDAQVIMELALYGAIAVVLGIAWLSRARGRIALTRMDLLLTAYVLFAIASTFWSSERAVSAVRSIQLVILFLLAEVLVRMLGPERTLRALGASLLAYVIVCALAAVTIPSAAGGFTDYYGAKRFSWFATHPISAAAAAGTALMFILAEALFLPGGWARRWYRVPLWLHGLVLLTIFLAAQSRAPAVALVVGTTALVLRRYGRAWTVPLLGATVAAAVVAISSGPTLPGLLRIGAASSNPVAEFLFRGQPLEEVEGLSGREALWQGAFTLFRERPVLGYGYQGSRYHLVQILGWGGHAHNALLEALLDLGVLGAALIWIPVGVCFFRSVIVGGRDPGVQSWCRAVILGVVSFMIVNAMADAGFTGTPSFDVLLMMGCILVQERLPGRSRTP
jgi:O-antigen ligase